jgi:hypothetical protein
MASDIAKLTGLALALRVMSEGGNTDGSGKTRIEVGQCKPFTMATVNALRKRGHRVTAIIPGQFFYAYPIEK